MKGDSPLESELRIPKIFKEVRSSSTVSQIIWHSRARKSEVFDPIAIPSASTSPPPGLRRADEPARLLPTSPGSPPPAPASPISPLPESSSLVSALPTAASPLFALPAAQLTSNKVGSPQPSTSTSPQPQVPSISKSAVRVEKVTDKPAINQKENPEVQSLQRECTSGVVVQPVSLLSSSDNNADGQLEESTLLLIEKADSEAVREACRDDRDRTAAGVMSVSTTCHEISSADITQLEGDTQPHESSNIQQELPEEDVNPDEEEKVDVDLLFKWQGDRELETCACVNEPLHELVECTFATPARELPSKSPDPASPQSEPSVVSCSTHLPETIAEDAEPEPTASTPLNSRPTSPILTPLPVLDNLSEEPSSYPQSPFSPTFSDEPLSPESGSSHVFGQVPPTPISPGTISSAWTEVEDTVFSESTSSAAPMPLLKRIERLKLGIVQLRNFPMDNDDVQLVVNVKFDAQEIFQSTTVPSGANCIFGDETNCELPPKFHALQLVLTQMLEGGRLTRPIGRVSLRRKELINENDSTEGWMPIVKIAGSQTTEILGDMCLDMRYDSKSKLLNVGVLDYTVWPLNTTTFASQNLQRLQDTNNLKAGVGPGRLYLRTCISSDKSLLSSMKKSRVVERRTLESIRLDCSQLFSSSSSTCSKSSKTHPEEDKSPIPKVNSQVIDPTKLPPKPPKAKAHQVSAAANQRISFKPTSQEDSYENIGHSLSVSSASASSSTVTTPNWKMAGTNSTPTPTPTLDASGNAPSKSVGNFFFPSTSSAAVSTTEKEHSKLSEPSMQSQHQLRLNIKVYSEATYDENSYCGYVRVPLDSKSILPKNMPLGPNWFNIKSRTVNSALDTPQAECNNPSPLTAKTTPVNSKDYSPAHFRHCSNPSTSSAASNHHLPSYHHKTGTGSLGKSGVLATRSQPLRPAPSLASLRGLLTGNSSSNAMGHCNPTASSSSKNKGRDASVDSLARAMCNANKLGEMRLRLWYNVEEVLPFFHYQPLYTNLIKSLNVRPYSSSLTSLLSYLPIDMEYIAKPLMKIFVHAHQIRAFFRLVCSEYVSSCHDVNTLFRSQTMASKIMYELMKFVGHDYLVISLKPLIDLIYAERKCCEIDPSKLKPGDSLEHNLRNITVYAELAFSRVVDSYSRCPHVLREVFLELREVVHTYFPDRDDVAIEHSVAEHCQNGQVTCSTTVSVKMASSILISDHALFAAAILNPKLFALKRDTPDADVCRTLVLVSKILQRLANCVVSSVPLTTKEQWLTPVLGRFSSDAHKTAMIDFLDGVSAISLTHDHPAAANDENLSPTIYKESPVVLLKHGQMVERRSGTDKKRSFKNLIHQKRRYVTLTETQLSWQKVKDTSSGESPSSEVDQHKGFALSDITAVSPLPEVKNSFRVATPSSEVHFQANNASEMNEWLIVIQKQQRRHIMQLNRPSSELSYLLPSSSKSSISTIVDVDMEREMQIIHSHFYEHLDTLRNWKRALEGQDLDQFLHHLHSSGGLRSADAMSLGLPLDKIFSANSNLEEQKTCLAKLRETIVTTIAAIEQIQAAHQSAKNLSYQMKLLQANPQHQSDVSSTKNMASLDQIISTSTTLSGQKMVDSENYLHLRQRNKRIKKSATNQFSASAKMPPSPLQPAITSENNTATSASIH